MNEQAGRAPAAQPKRELPTHLLKRAFRSTVAAKTARSREAAVRRLIAPEEGQEERAREYRREAELHEKIVGMTSEELTFGTPVSSVPTRDNKDIENK